MIDLSSLPKPVSNEKRENLKIAMDAVDIPPGSRWDQLIRTLKGKLFAKYIILDVEGPTSGINKF
jgi:hypothetical protein